MSDYKKQLETIQAQVEAKKIELAKLTERQETLAKEQTKLLEQLKEQGIDDPTQLAEKILALEAQIQEQLAKCQTILK